MLGRPAPQPSKENKKFVKRGKKKKRESNFRSREQDLSRVEGLRKNK
jgi:heme-degrading monooxygenase HmoA